MSPSPHLLHGLSMASLSATATRARSRAGHVSLWSIVGLLIVAYVGGVAGLPPPSVQVLRVVGIVPILPTLWFVWVDRTRKLRVDPDLPRTLRRTPPRAAPTLICRRASGRLRFSRPCHDAGAERCPSG